jgi:competence protein ComEA
MRITLRGFAGIALLSSLLALAAPVVAAEVNLNTATQEELVALPGIGPAKAQAIIDYRTAHPFKSVDEVKNVRGIGDHLYESLKGKVTVSSAGSAEGR